MIVSVSVVYLHNRVADWELGFPAIAPPPKRESQAILLAQEKDQDTKSEVWFLPKMYCFCNIVKLESFKLNVSWGRLY